MGLSPLRTFCVVAETLNFTRAAERAGLTPAAARPPLGPAARTLEGAGGPGELLRGGEHSPKGRVRAAAATQAIVHLFAPLFERVMRTHAGIDASFRPTPR